MSVINTNYLSLVAQNNLQKSQSALGSAIERLSSGLRINSAKDDAAGQAIANRMTSQVKGLNQAQRNANDGISVAQTAEGALNQVNDNLQRVRELTVQAANGTNSQDDLSSIQAEIDQRLKEINRISDETNFNGVKVLASNQELQIQVGANDNETIDIGLEAINKTTLGLGGFTVSGLSGAITEFTSVTGGVTTTKEVDLSAAKTALGDDNLTLHGYGAYDEATGTYASYAVKGGDGTMYTIEKGAAASAASKLAFDPATGDVVAHATFVAADFKEAESTAYDAMVTAGGLVATANPLAALDSALKKVDTLRSDLGAIQNRFESAITNLQTNSTNLQAARSRIEDADYAVEVANMSKNQILQQAGTSVLAQANQIPQGVLSLLR